MPEKLSELVKPHLTADARKRMALWGVPFVRSLATDEWGCVVCKKVLLSGVEMHALRGKPFVQFFEKIRHSPCWKEARDEQEDEG